MPIAEAWHESTPQSALIHLVLARLHLVLDRTDDAEAFALQARELDPSMGEAWAIELATGLASNQSASELLLAELLSRVDHTSTRLTPVLDMLLHFAPTSYLPQATTWADRLLAALPADQLPLPRATASVAARLHGRAGNLERASELLAPSYDDADAVAEDLDGARDDAMRLAAAGHAGPTLAVLQVSASAPQLEPLVVALAHIAGQPLDAPLEVAEVAAHVRRRIEGLAASDDPWRIDPRTLPLTEA